MITNIYQQQLGSRSRMLHSSASRPAHKHRHQTSMDNFIKNIKKHNQRSQRYMSPPLLYMYSRNHTTNTIDKSRSRTLSNRKSSGGVLSKAKKKIDKILHSKSKTDSIMDTQRNPAYIIEECGSKLKKLQKYLERKNQVAHYLCQNFLKMLNEIVEKMISNLDTQLRDIQNKAIRSVEGKYKKQLSKLQRQNGKLEGKLKESLQKLNNNSSLIYHVRMLSQIDLDYIYGKCILGTEECGGQGYGKQSQSENQFKNSQDSQLQKNQQLQRPIGAKNYPQELFQFDRYYPQKPGNMKITLGGGREEHGQDQLQKQIESGRIRPLNDWKKRERRQYLEAEEDQAQQLQPVRRPLARRLT